MNIALFVIVLNLINTNGEYILATFVTDEARGKFDNPIADRDPVLLHEDDLFLVRDGNDDDHPRGVGPGGVFPARPFMQAKVAPVVTDVGRFRMSHSFALGLFHAAHYTGGSPGGAAAAPMR